MKKLIFIIFLLFTTAVYARDYVSRVGKIYVTELTPINTWVEILPASRTTGIRGYKARTRVTPGEAPGFFDIAFSSNPNTNSDVADGTGFLSYTGAGFGDTFSPSNGVWARTRSTGTVVLEVITFE